MSTTNTPDIAAIRARIAADRASDRSRVGLERCAVCDGEGDDETPERRALLEHAPADLAVLCPEVERLMHERDHHQHKAEEWEESAGIERVRAEAAEAERDALRVEIARLREIAAAQPAVRHAVRMHCVAICEIQEAMLATAGDADGAKGARLCADVLRVLTPAALPHLTPAG